MAKHHHPPQGPPRREEEEEEDDDTDGEEEELEAQVHRKPPAVLYNENRAKPVHLVATDNDTSYRKPPRSGTASIGAVITIILLVIGLTALTVWLVYRPQKPHFTVTSAAIYTLNSTTPTIPPPLITTTIQFTIVSRNPNRRTALYYDHLAATVFYHNQAITPPLQMPPLYHYTKSTVMFSPVLGGVAVPVSMDVANGLMTDLGYGIMGLRLMILGRVKYKAGIFKTGHYGAIVKCDVLIRIRKGQLGQAQLLQNRGCKVDI